MKSYGVTIQMKLLQQYFHVVPFCVLVFQKMKVVFFFLIFTLATSRSLRVKKAFIKEKSSISVGLS